MSVTQAGILKVLIVDDAIQVCMALARLLHAGTDGLSIDRAGTVADGKKALLERAPDVVLLDMHLPDGQGSELLPASCPLPYRPEYIMLSNDSSQRTRTRCLEAGASLFFDKTWEFEAAAMAVHAISLRHRMQISGG